MEDAAKTARPRDGAVAATAGGGRGEVAAAVAAAATPQRESPPTRSGRAPLFLAAALLRLLLSLAFPNLPDLLTSRVEISTPMTSFKRLQEGLFLYNHNVSPYDGGVYHQAPLLLPLFSLLPDCRAHPVFTTLLYVLVDLFSADALARIADSGESSASRLFASPRRGRRWSGSAVAAAFLFNPFTVATCLGRSTAVFTTAAVLHAISRAIAGASLGAVASLSFAAYLSMYPVLLLPSLILLAFDRRGRGGDGGSSSSSGGGNNKNNNNNDNNNNNNINNNINNINNININNNITNNNNNNNTHTHTHTHTHAHAHTHTRSLSVFAAVHVAAAALCVAALLGMSRLVAGSWAFLWATYGVHLTLQDLTPNIGLWWYFFVEMFDSFRAFFLAVFWLHLASYVAGLGVRFRAQPLGALSVLLGIFSIFKPYPSLADASLFFAVVSLWRHVFPLMRHSFVAAAIFLYTTFLGPAFYYLWIYAGSGNANFFYAITLVWSLGQSLLLSDLAFSILRDEWEADRPEMAGRDIRQI